MHEHTRGGFFFILAFTSQMMVCLVTAFNYHTFLAAEDHLLLLLIALHRGLPLSPSLYSVSFINTLFHLITAHTRVSRTAPLPYFGLFDGLLSSL